MALRFRYRLTSREKDALLSEQAALIEAQAAELERRAARIAALEALLTKPKKTSQNSVIAQGIGFWTASSLGGNAPLRAIVIA